MKKAKKYLGRKVLLKTGDENTIYYTEEKRNITRSFEDFKNDIENNYYSSIELLEDNLNLYKCEVFKTDNLAKLVEIRNQISNKCKYDTLLTKKEIVDLLKDSYIVCLEGFKEIDLNDVDNLLD